MKPTPSSILDEDPPSPRLPDRGERRPFAVRLPYRPLWEVARGLMAQAPGVVFLDAGGASDAARWSILGWQPREVFLWPQGKPGALPGLRRHLLATRCGGDPPAEVPLCSGWLGWFSYDLGRHFEQLPEHARTDTTIPDFALGYYDVVLLEDRVNGTLWAAGTADDSAHRTALLQRAEAAAAVPETATGACNNDVATTARDTDPALPHLSPPPADPQPLMARAVYEQNVRTILEHIRAGDIYQANFSHRFAGTTREDSRRIYSRLRAASPAPYGCYLSLPGAPEVMSVSPELFLHKVGALLRTRPIKGTRPRGADAAGDRLQLQELTDSEKERAELLMITDLLRNDLGRVAAYGTVTVPQLRVLESHPTVHHAYSVIEARMGDDHDFADLLAATLPGGSVTGAPKIRAMEILDTLEPLRRGPYTGAAGFIADNGDLCLNILIRTVVRQGERVWYQVGGGIVADSQPAAEYEETLAKGAALQRALLGI